MSVGRDYEEFLRLLNVHGVKYLIIGAYAVSYYAKPRFTKDLDILVGSSPPNAKKILVALKDFGFASLKISQKDLSDPKSIIQLGFAPNRIDLMGSIEGVNFKSAWKNRTLGIYGKEKVFYLSLKDLIRTKKAAGRNQDRIDLKYLKEMRKE